MTGFLLTLGRLSLLGSLLAAALLLLRPLLRGRLSAALGYYLWLPVLLRLCLLFGAWLCFRVKERLPAYYDQNNISFYGDGVFRINLAGVRFHNGNWPYIIRAMRVWLLGLMVLFPVLWGVIHSLWPGHALTLEMPLTMICLFGMLIAAIVAGKRHE